jgi:hypothetical protein
MSVLGNVAVVEISYTQIEQGIEDKGKAQQGEIHAKLLGADNVLYLTVDSENEEGLNGKIKR